MGTQQRRAREREELRDLILSTARELFAAEGYEAVSMRKIAERIEYSPTAIYGYFADKQALFRELCEKDFLALAFEFQAIARIADPVERFRAVGRAYVHFGLDHPNHYRLMFMTPHPPVELSEERVHRGNPEEDAYAFLKGILAAIQAEGRLRPEFADLEAASQVAWAAVHGIVSLHIAKCNDAWVEWRPAPETTELLIAALARGMTQEARP